MTDLIARLYETEQKATGAVSSVLTKSACRDSSFP